MAGVRAPPFGRIHPWVRSHTFHQIPIRLGLGFTMRASSRSISQCPPLLAFHDGGPCCQGWRTGPRSCPVAYRTQDKT